ncbi:uncharacterized protein [Littorina saxatilis]|uniref:uncharacterized protein n=1 Tax=Littorina saxatilis TaxID=31220 RepID=UPI0038B4DCE1
MQSQVAATTGDYHVPQRGYLKLDHHAVPSSSSIVTTRTPVTTSSMTSVTTTLSSSTYGSFTYTDAHTLQGLPQLPLFTTAQATTRDTTHPISTMGAPRETGRFDIYGLSTPPRHIEFAPSASTPRTEVLDPRLRHQFSSFLPSVSEQQQRMDPAHLPIGFPSAASTGLEGAERTVRNPQVRFEDQASMPNYGSFNSPTSQHDSYLESVTKTLAEALTLNRLPLQEPCVFSGDPLLYPTWKASFSFLIERQNIRSNEKLLYLQRFGNSYVTSTAFRTKLDNWPVVKTKDPVALRCLADFLQQCAVAAKEVGGLEILNDAHYLKNIVEKLPDWMVRRWARNVVSTKLNKQRYPTFDELVTFVTYEAEIATDPVFGIMPSTSVSAKLPVKSKVVMATSGESAEAKCEFCGYSGHDILACRGFMKGTAKERQEFVFKSGLCFGCLLSVDHRSRQCKQRATCETCSKRHPTCMHDEDFVPFKDTDSNSAPTTSTNYATHLSSKPMESASANAAQSDSCGALTAMIVPVYVSSIDNPDREVLTYALLDTMSDATFAVSSVVESLGATATQTTLKLSTLTENDTLIPCTKYTGLRVRSYFSQSDWIKLPPAFSRDFLDLHKDHVPTPETVARHPHLRRLATNLIPLQPNCEAGLLIGYDCAEALMPVSIVSGVPYGVETRLVWSVVGRSTHPTSFDSIGSSHQVRMQQSAGEEDRVAFVYRPSVKEASASDLLIAIERDFVDLEVGQTSQDDLRFLKIIQDNVTINSEGHYEMPLPFRSDNPALTNNRGAALKRVMGLKRQFERRPEYLRDYLKFMKVILDRGDAEKVPADEIVSSTRRYIPHHGVYNPKKPGKIRVVFDCSAQHFGVCLNDLLLQGPDLISSLVGVLCRFRKGPVAFACDIEKMYHQFHVSKPHRD